MPSKARFLFKKGVADVILCLDRAVKAGYYEIYMQNFVVSRQTFVDMPEKFEKEGLLERKIVENRPSKVEYSLTDKGKEKAGILTRLERNL